MFKKERMILLLIILVGCSSMGPSINSAESVVYRGVVILDYPFSHSVADTFVEASMQNNERIKLRMKDYVIRYKFVIKELSEVRIVQKIVTNNGLHIMGMYVYAEDIIYVALVSDDVVGTFAHELGHAVWDCLSDEQQLEWIKQYIVRLDAANLEYPLNSKWSKATDHESRQVPSKYCLYGPGEYYAEVFMFYCIDKEHLERGKFKAEHDLMDKQVKELNSAYNKKTKLQ